MPCTPKMMFPLFDVAAVNQLQLSQLSQLSAAFFGPQASMNGVVDYNIAPTHNDVLLGRGVATNRHPGNENFRAIVSQHIEVYVTSTKKQKMMISRSIVDTVRTQLNPPGRFLVKNHQTGLWSVVSYKRALEKTAQALRDGAAPLRKRMSDSFGEADDDDSSLGSKAVPQEEDMESKKRQRTAEQYEDITQSKKLRPTRSLNVDMKDTSLDTAALPGVANQYQEPVMPMEQVSSSYTECSGYSSYTAIGPTPARRVSYTNQASSINLGQYDSSRAARGKHLNPSITSAEGCLSYGAFGPDQYHEETEEYHDEYAPLPLKSQHDFGDSKIMRDAVASFLNEEGNTATEEDEFAKEFGHDESFFSLGKSDGNMIRDYDAIFDHSV